MSDPLRWAKARIVGYQPITQERLPLDPDEDEEDAEFKVLVARLRRLPHEVDSTFDARVAAAVAARLDEGGGIELPRRRPMHPRWRRDLVLGAVGVVVATVVVVALAVFSGVSRPRVATLGPSAERRAIQLVVAQVARAEAGVDLHDMSYTEQVINTTPPDTTEPNPPPASVVYQVQVANATHWLVTEHVTLADGDTEKTLVVADGATAWSENLITHHAQVGLSTSLPQAFAYGPYISPTALGSQVRGRCARRVYLDANGPLVDGQHTEVLDLGASPCPSAAFPAADGPATFTIDRPSGLLLEATLRYSNGTLAQRIMVSNLHVGLRMPASDFPSSPPPGTLEPNQFVGAIHRLGQLDQASSFTPLIPISLPAGFTLGAIRTPIGEIPGGKLASFTLIYDAPSGEPALVITEYNHAPNPGVPPELQGRAVTLPDGLAAYLTTWTSPRPGGATVSFLDLGITVDVSQGTVAYGIHVADTLPTASLLAIAGSLREYVPAR